MLVREHEVANECNEENKYRKRRCKRQGWKIKGQQKRDVKRQNAREEGRVEESRCSCLITRWSHFLLLAHSFPVLIA